MGGTQSGSALPLPQPPHPNAARPSARVIAGVRTIQGYHRPSWTLPYMFVVFAPTVVPYVLWVVLAEAGHG